MQQLITLSYHIKGNEVRPKFLSAYKKLDSYIIKLDVLQDAIHYLTKEYEETLKNKDKNWTTFDDVIVKQGTQRWKFKE
jgi:hypothetical protein